MNVLSLEDEDEESTDEFNRVIKSDDLAADWLNLEPR